MKRLFKTIHEKGDRSLPEINYYVAYEIQTVNFRAKVRAIYLGKQKGTSRRVIARSIGVSPSTVSGEIRRNSNRHGRYSWRLAQDRKER